MEKMVHLLEQKVDLTQFDSAQRQLDNKADKQELFSMKQDISGKAERADIDVYIMAVQNQKLEID